MRYPILKLPKPIGDSLELELLRRHYRIPHTLLVTPSTSYTYYMKGKENKIGFVIDVSLSLKEKIDPLIQGYLQFEKKGYILNYMPFWGCWNGDLSSRIGDVNYNKTERVLNPKHAIIKCYIDHHTLLASGEVIFNPIDMPPAIPEVKLTDRERLIIFIFAKLKEGAERFMILTKFKITQAEILNLVKKDVLKPTNNGYKITTVGLATRSDNPKTDRW